MKKYLLVLFASLLFAFNGNAQCTNSAGEIMLSSTFFCVSLPTSILSTPATNISTNFVVDWEQSNDGQNWSFARGRSFNDMLDIPTYSLYSTTFFRKKITDLNAAAPCNIVYSNLLVVNPIRAFPGVISGNDTICSGQINSSTINSIKEGGSSELITFNYHWFQSTGNNSFTLISGATNETYNPSNLTVTTRYQRVVDLVNFSCFESSNIITKTVMTCGTFSTSITGTASIIPNQTATYSVPATIGMQYTWTVTGGTITSGQGTNTITVLWDGTGSANSRTTASGYSVSVTETDATPESKTTTQEITMNSNTTTGINKGFGATGISVFPNPVKNQFTVEMPTTNNAVNYTVYSTTGVQMQSGSFIATASGNTISTQLPSGMYQLVLNYDGVFTSTRLAVVE